MTDIRELEIMAARRQIYAKTNRIYVRYKGQLGSNDLGFKILCGPPRLNAPALFIGYQPT